MRDAGVPPDLTFLNSLIASCEKGEHAGGAVDILERMEAGEFAPARTALRIQPQRLPLRTAAATDAPDGC